MVKTPTPADLQKLRQTFQHYVKWNEEEWERIEKPWKIKTLGVGEMVTRAGQMENYLYYILSGIHRMYFLSDKGEEVILGFAYDGNFSGAFDALIRREPAKVSLEALTPCRMLAISGEALHELFNEFKTLERWGRLFITDILSGRTVREIELATLSAEQRYLNFIKRQPKILQQVPQKYLASYLGMTPETFSRMRRKRRGG